MSTLLFCYGALEQLGQISGLDLIIISIVSATLGIILGSFSRSPSQFARATWQRLLFMLWTPIAILMILTLFAVRIGFLMLKLSLKLLIAAVVGLAYLVMPIDLVPDFLIGLGQIDDLFIITSLTFWAFSAAAMGGLRSSIVSRRPTIDFP